MILMLHSFNGYSTLSPPDLISNMTDGKLAEELKSLFCSETRANHFSLLDYFLLLFGLSCFDACRLTLSHRSAL